MIVHALVAAYATRHPTTSSPRRRRSRHPVRTAAVLAAAIALGAPAAPALAGVFTLNLAQQSEAVVGRPLMLLATGTVPPVQPGDITLPYWFSLDAIPTAVSTTCPPDRWEGAQFANANGGSIVVLSQSENRDAAGNFTIPVAVTPIAPGSVLLCGYTDDGEAITLANASLMLDIKAAPPSAPRGGSRPPSPADYAAQGIRSCRALLEGSEARSCIRKVLRKANARCRRLPSRNARTRCLHAVRRAARSS